jgi:hypothetical protein
MTIVNLNTPLDHGKELQLAKESITSANTCTYAFSLDAEAALLSIFVSATTGDVNVQVFTEGSDGTIANLYTFPTISSPTSELILKQIVPPLRKLRVKVTCTDTATFELRARGVSATLDRRTKVDENNSTSTPLGIGGVYVGEAIDVSEYSTVTTSLYADASSADEGAQFQFSSDGINWDDTYNFTLNILESNTRRFQFPVTAKFFRIQYTNGSVAQTEFRVQTFLHPNSTITSIHRVDGDLVKDRSTTITKSVLAGRDHIDTTFYRNIDTIDYNALLVSYPPTQLDAFGHMRVSNAETVFEFDMKQEIDAEKFDTSVTGGATVVHNATTVSTELNTTTASGDKAILQSYAYLPYFKGKGQKSILTGNLYSGGHAGLRVRYGLFDEANGAFFEINGTDIKVVLRSSVTGSVVDTEIAQADWNYDTLNGNGRSGITLDLSKQQIFTIDFAWLGTGDVRFGFVIDGKTRYCHIIGNTNKNLFPYSQSGMLPVRAEIENVTAQVAARKIQVTCGTVISEGGDVNIGKLRVIDSGVTPVALTTTEKVIAGFRLKSTVSNAALRPILFKLFGALGNDVIYYKVIYNPTLTGATWTGVSAISEKLTNNPTYSGGTILNSGYFDLGGGNSSLGAVSSGSGPTSFEPDLYLGWDIGGTPIPIILVAVTVAGTGSVLYSNSFREYT